MAGQGWKHAREFARVLAPIGVTSNKTKQKTVVRCVGSGAFAANRIASSVPYLWDLHATSHRGHGFCLTGSFCQLSSPSVLYKHCTQERSRLSVSGWARGLSSHSWALDAGVAHLARTRSASEHPRSLTNQAVKLGVPPSTLFLRVSRLIWWQQVAERPCTKTVPRGCLRSDDVVLTCRLQRAREIHGAIAPNWRGGESWTSAKLNCFSPSLPSLTEMCEAPFHRWIFQCSWLLRNIYASTECTRTHFRTALRLSLGSALITDIIVKLPCWCRLCDLILSATASLRSICVPTFLLTF